MALLPIAIEVLPRALALSPMDTLDCPPPRTTTELLPSAVMPAKDPLVALLPIATLLLAVPEARASLPIANES